MPWDCGLGDCRSGGVLWRDSRDDVLLLGCWHYYLMSAAVVVMTNIYIHRNYNYIHVTSSHVKQTIVVFVSDARLFELLRSC